MVSGVELRGDEVTTAIDDSRRIVAMRARFSRPVGGS